MSFHYGRNSRLKNLGYHLLQLSRRGVSGQGKSTGISVSLSGQMWEPHIHTLYSIAVSSSGQMTLAVPRPGNIARDISIANDKPPLRIVSNDVSHAKRNIDNPTFPRHTIHTTPVSSHLSFVIRQ